MPNEYWQRQKTDSPLFPDLLWSKPENRAFAGKLLIVGGNVHSFAAAAESYAEAEKAGVGTTRVVLPDSLQKTVGKIFAAGEYAPSTPSGSFAKLALAELLTMGDWAEGVLLAGDLGRNSETAVVLEQLTSKHSGQLTITKDAIDYFTPAPKAMLARPNTLLVLSFSQLQKLAISARSTVAYTFNMDLLRLIDALHDFTLANPVAIITKHLETVIVACGGKVVTTKLNVDMPVWRVRTAAHAATLWLQNPSKQLEALASAIYQLQSVSHT